VENPARFVASLVNSLLANKPAIVRAADHLRQFMHVEDVAGALVATLNSSVEGIVNVASNETLKLGDLAGILASLTGKQSLLQLEHAPGTPDNPAVLIGDTAKLRSTGFRPKYDLKTGLATLLKP
jgi:nucleoside-diphosphate-sugar epimerase